MRRPVLRAAALCAGFWLTGAVAAESEYPFLGAWIKANRTCSVSSTRERIYTPREVTSARGRCAIRKVAAGANATFELFERCEHPNERPTRVNETIRMTGTDGMVLTRRTARLKLSRSIAFVRCPTPAVSKPGR